MRAFVCVGFGPRYAPYRRRLERTVKEHWDGDCLFYDALPPGSPTHQEVNYGFKLFAIKDALKRGYTSILYGDACMVCRGDLRPAFEEIERVGYVLVKDGHRLREWASDSILDWSGLERRELGETTSAAGGFLGLDFTHPQGRLLWQEWNDAYDRGLTPVLWRNHKPEDRVKSVAMHTGQHISDDPSVLGSMGEEAVFGALAYKHNLKVWGSPNPWCPQDDSGVFQSTGYDQGKFGELDGWQVFDNHSVFTDTLTPGGVVLDVGSRGFGWTTAMLERGMYVHALDPSPDVDMIHSQVCFSRVGLVGVGSSSPHLRRPHDRAAWWLSDTPDDSSIPVPTVDLPTYMRQHKIEEWEAVKLNCEGAEYDILETWPGPIAKQVCVSFHEHTGRGRDRTKLLERMARWYTIAQDPHDERYGAGLNHWDTVFLRV